MSASPILIFDFDSTLVQFETLDVVERPRVDPHRPGRGFGVNVGHGRTIA